MPAVPDPRISRLADVLCRYSLEVERGDVVLVHGPVLAQPLFLELTKTITELGAHPVLRPDLASVQRMLLERGSDAQLQPTRLEELENELATKYVTIWAEPNTHHLSDVPAARQALYSSARRELNERFFARISSGEARWCGTAFPCEAAAQDAGMSLVEWEDFVYGAGHLEDGDPVAHWREQSKRQQEIAERLSQIAELRIVAEDTELVVATGGRRWLNADGKQNFPDGEVYTSPEHTRTQGHVRFSFDAALYGRELSGVRLWFEDGRVVREEAARGADFLTEMLDQDDGARYLGEVAFGLNDEIQQATKDVLFDEKIGGTFHLALGMAFPEAGGTNVSGLHWDLVCDLRSGGEVYGDGELIARDGAFV
jgi:aminopeptidase